MANTSTDSYSNHIPICLKCFNPLSSFQLNLQEAMNICLHQSCLSGSLEIYQNSYKNTQPVTEKFNSFYTEEKYINSNSLIFCMSDRIKSETNKLNCLLEKFDQPKLQGFDEPDLDLIDQSIVNEHTKSENLELMTDQTYSDTLLSDLNLIDFADLMNMDTSIIEQSLDCATKNTEECFITDLQSVKEEFIFQEQSNVHQDIELVGSFSKNETKSSITIEKIPNKNIPKPANEIKISNLKLIDDKDDLNEFIKSNESNNVLKNDHSLGKQALLPWEMKSKYKPKKRLEINQFQKVNKSENIPRIESKSILNTNIKQLGSTLKKNILNNTTLLSNLKTSNASSGGYKDLVLSVLKKKT